MAIQDLNKSNEVFPRRLMCDSTINQTYSWHFKSVWPRRWLCYRTAGRAVLQHARYLRGALELNCCAGGVTAVGDFSVTRACHRPFFTNHSKSASDMLLIHWNGCYIICCRCHKQKEHILAMQINWRRGAAVTAIDSPCIRHTSKEIIRKKRKRKRIG